MPSTLRRLAALFGAFALTTILLPATAVPVAAGGGSTLVSIANDYRVGAGLGPVALHGVIEQIAVERGGQMAREGRLGHDFDYLKRRLAEEGICYGGLGEIVAHNSSGDFARFGEQWYTSTAGHREIMLGNYTHAGGSRERGGDGRYYAAMVFVRLCGGSTPASPSGFTDIGSSEFAADIRWLVAEEITSGCSAARYCPRSSVTRAQMASFLRRATGIPSSAVNAFVDDGNSVHEGDINGVAVARITAGCTDVRYCPGAVVTRGQMASFLARALSLPASTRDWFRDDNRSMHEPAINRLAAAGITGGCSSGRFCPDASVTREQMAGFLRRAFGG